jgi:hypothetical protein
MRRYPPRILDLRDNCMKPPRSMIAGTLLVDNTLELARY